MSLKNYLISEKSKDYPFLLSLPGWKVFVRSTFREWFDQHNETDISADEIWSDYMRSVINKDKPLQRRVTFKQYCFKLLGEYYDELTEYEKYSLRKLISKYMIDITYINFEHLKLKIESVFEDADKIIDGMELLWLRYHSWLSR